MALHAPAPVKIPAVLASILTPLSTQPVVVRPPAVVALVVALGVNVRLALTTCAVVPLGLSALGNVPTASSGKPLAVSARAVVEQVPLAVLLALTANAILKLLWL